MKTTAKKRKKKVKVAVMVKVLIPIVMEIMEIRLKQLSRLKTYSIRYKNSTNKSNHLMEGYS